MDCFSQCGVAVPWSGFRRLDICWSAQPRASWLGTNYAILDTFGISGRSDPPSNSTYREGFKKRRKFSSFCLPPPMERCRYFSNIKSIARTFFFNEQKWDKVLILPIAQFEDIRGIINLKLCGERRGSKLIWWWIFLYYSNALRHTS